MSRGKSIPILRMTERSVKIDIKALNSVLEQIGDRYFVCYSTAGPKRTGKSFILNKCLHFLHAKQKTKLKNWFQRSISGEEKYFEWRGGSERNTTGINIWSKPFFTQYKGKEIAILLMDTQGSFDDQTTFTQNSIVFALSALMSSTLIYNIPKDIAEDTFQFLQLFSSYAKLAITDDEQSEGSAFQRLIFLIRDFQFRDFKCGYYDEKTCPPGQPESKNFRHKLDANPSQPNEVRVLRQQILSSFENVGVFALPHPGNTLALEDDETNLDQFFAKHAKDFVELIFSDKNIELKKVGPVVVTGSDFKKYITEWAKLFEGNELPEMATISQAAAEMQNKILIQNSLTKYDKKMKEIIEENPLGISQRKFDKLHLELEEKIVDAFKKIKKLGGKTYEAKFLKELTDAIEEKKTIYQNMNTANFKATQQHNEMKSEIKKAVKKVKEESRKEREELEEKFKHQKLEDERTADKTEQQREINELKEEIEKIKRGNKKQEPVRVNPLEYPEPWCTTLKRPPITLLPNPLDPVLSVLDKAEKVADGLGKMFRS